MQRPVAVLVVALFGLAVPAGCDDQGVLVSDDDTDVEEWGEVPRDEPWVRREVPAPGPMTFTELHYNPATDPDLEWIELHNPMAFDLDLSGWALEGGVGFSFAPGTIAPAGGYLVLAADPDRLGDVTGFTGALGPYDGRLDDDRARVDLRNNGGRLIDTVEYGDDHPWPVHPDGSGFPLAKVHATAASDRAEHWTVADAFGGTPGRANGLDPLEPPTLVELVALDARWSWDLSGDYPAPDWAAPDYDASAWPSALAVFYAGEEQVDVSATVRVTADNFYGLYLGGADGSDLRLVGEDPDGSWTTVESFALDVGPRDHLYLAAWEASGGAGGPQMTIAEAEAGGDLVGTGSATFEWVLGPVGAGPGPQPANPSPSESEIALVVEDAEADGAWAPPAVEAGRTSAPWGGAVGGAFDDATRYVWPDTFAAVSVTNTDDTYALFRSVAPLTGPSGATELPSIPTTATFRTAFAFDADPAATDLSISCLVDDGAVVHLNGVEVLRSNMPDGPVTAGTLAAARVDGPDHVDASVPADALVRGDNVLAVEVHQAEPDDLDLTFGCALTARIGPALGGGAALLLDEVARPDVSRFWVELLGAGAQPRDTDGLLLSSSAGGELALPPGLLEPGETRSVDVDLPVEAGDVLFLTSADGRVLHDAVRVHAGFLARERDGGPWRHVRDPTPGEPNIVPRTEDVVIHEIQYHRAPLSADGEPVTPRPEEWIELYNRGEDDVDLAGWQLVDAVAFEFPSGTVLAPDAYLVVAGDADALRAEYPGVRVVGDLSGRLSNAGDRIVLLDALGNPADEVRYFDAGRWPAAADGGGSSLELRDPWADNASPEAWAASDEATRSAWTTYRRRGIAEPSAVGPDGRWHELVIGLLDAGEVLLDDVSVTRDPDGARIEMVPAGGFDGGAAAWRLLGNHRHSEVVPDPDDPGNPVLRLVATGPTGHMHNHAETTTLEPIGTHEYEVSFRARWISGSNQVHTRLYFNRLARTARVERPEVSGTPGAANSTAEVDVGPTFDSLRHDPVVPAPGEPVSVTVAADDPDGVLAATLWSSVDDAPFQPREMTRDAAGRWGAELEGGAAGTIVQVYVEAEDGRGSRSMFPAAGPDSRALIRFDDDPAPSGLRAFRILVTPADADRLHREVDLMSNDLVGATVVYADAEVFYDVGVRLKGSQRGRPRVPRLGYGVRFHAEQPFRGSHESVMLDRSEGVGFGQREVLVNLMMTAGGSESGEYNDVVHVVTPRPEHTGAAELQLDRFSNLVLGSQFADGSAGTRFEYELVYYPTTTDDGTPEGLKRPQPDQVVGTPLTDLGDDPEAYRWTFLIKNNEIEDDYGRVIDLCRTFGLPGAELLAGAPAVIDVEQWLRAFAFSTLSGARDQYGGAGSRHNAQFYVRPEDDRVLFFPHDLDFFGSARMDVVNNGDLARLLADPAHRRSYYGHLEDIVSRVYNAEYMGPWCDQLGALLPGQSFAAHCAFIAERADWVLDDSPESVTALFPPAEFRITTEGGADFSVDAAEVVLEGEAWVDVRRITLDGAAEPLVLEWVDDRTWRIVVPLGEGPNEVALTATDLRGDVVGADSIVVTSTPGG